MRLLILFTVVPLVELYLLFWIAQRTSLLWTVGLVLATGILGAALARWQGWRTLNRMQQELSVGRAPTESIVDGLLILIAGALLITPGVITDVVGFLLLVPFCRTMIRKVVAHRLKQRMEIHRFSAFGPERPEQRRDEIIDVEIVSPPADEDPARRPSPP